MTIYATPFDPTTMLCTGPSTDAGFVSLDAVVEIMGEEWAYKTKRMVIYQTGETRVAFTDWLLHIDEPDTNG